MIKGVVNRLEIEILVAFPHFRGDLFQVCQSPTVDLEHFSISDGIGLDIESIEIAERIAQRVSELTISIDNA